MYFEENGKIASDDSALYNLDSLEPMKLNTKRTPVNLVGTVLEANKDDGYFKIDADDLSTYKCEVDLKRNRNLVFLSKLQEGDEINVRLGGSGLYLENVRTFTGRVLSEARVQSGLDTNNKPQYEHQFTLDSGKTLAIPDVNMKKDLYEIFHRAIASGEKQTIKYTDTLVLRADTASRGNSADFLYRAESPETLKGERFSRLFSNLTIGEGAGGIRVSPSHPHEATGRE